MTLVELLRKIVTHTPGITDVEQREAEALLSRLERLNAFGTTAGETTIQVHDYLPTSLYDSTCKYCGKEPSEHVQR